MKMLSKITLLLIMGAFVSFPAIRLLASPEEPTKEELKNDLAEIERQIKEFEQVLATTKSEKQTLTVAIKRLKNEQERLRLQIRSTSLQIDELNGKIKRTQKKIEQTTARISRYKDQIAVMLRLLNQKDQELLIETLSNEGGLAGAYVEMTNYNKISSAVGRLVQEAKATQEYLTKEKYNYAEAQDEAKELFTIKTIQQKELGNNLTEQATLLRDTQGREDQFQSALQDQKKRAAQIRSRLYELVGGVRQISFGEAVEIATWVGSQIGVRPAFLLAVLTQESNLGKNVGTCNRPGDPEEKSWRVIMKPERDHEPFLAITAELGKDPDTTPVSCPMRGKDGKRIGWGGAMGPAQFIPSTWMGYKDKVAAFTGKSPANPWDIRDAFIAAAIKLKADGAGSKTEKGEWTAAMKYFAGSVNLKFRFYGDNVAKLTEKYQKDIEDIK